MRPRGQTPRMLVEGSTAPLRVACFNEAAGADPADASLSAVRVAVDRHASMRPRGQTPRMRDSAPLMSPARDASMRPRGQTPRMPDA